MNVEADDVQSLLDHHEPSGDRRVLRMLCSTRLAF